MVTTRQFTSAIKAGEYLRDEFNRRTRGPLFRLTRDVMEAEGENWKQRVQARFSPYSGGRYLVDLQTRSGSLRDSISYSVKGASLGSLTLTKFSENRHAALHEYGTAGKSTSKNALPTIVPKRSQWLTIPVGDALGANGVPINASARDWPDLRFVPHATRDDTAFLVPRDAETLAEALYILKKSVDVPPRLGMHAVDRLMQKSRRRGFARAMKRALSGEAR